MIRPNLVPCLAAVLLTITPAAADPNQADPEAPFNVRPDSEAAKRLVVDAGRLHREAAQEIAGYLDKQEKDQLRQAGMDKIGQTHAKLLQLERLAQRLILRGEPAGADFHLRGQMLTPTLRSIIGDYTALPGVNEKLSQAFGLFRGLAQKKSAALTKVSRAIESNEWEAADETLHEAIDDLEVMAVWYLPQRRSAVMGPFRTMAVRVDQEVRTIREQRTAAALQKVRNELTPDYDAILQSIGDATAALAKRGQIDLDGRPLSGPQWIDHLTQRWEAAQHAALRCRGFDWAGRTLEAVARERDLAKRHSLFHATAPSALAELIRADAARTHPPQIEPLYLAYIGALTPLASRMADDSFIQAIRPALEELAAKSPQFAGQATTYRAVTQDMLRWRHRTAEASAKAHLEEYALVDAVYLEAAKAGPDLPGLLRHNAIDTSAAQFLTPAADVMRRLTDELMGRRIVALNLAGLATTPKMAIAQYRFRHYARVVLSEEFMRALSVEAAALESDLLVGPGQMPLTLEASVAIYNARHPNLAAVGGSVTGLTMESLVNRFATLSASGRTLVALGPLPPEPDANDSLAQVLLRFEIEPAWIANEYFYVARP